MSPPGSSGRLQSFGKALAVCGAVVLVDQVSKAIVVSSLSVGQSERVAFGFKVSNTPNSGLAFGIGSGHGAVMAVTIAALAVVIAWFALDPTRPGLWLAVGLLVGGALGNLADRVRVDAVTDFIDPPLWPTFNLADVAITLGAVALVLVSIGSDTDRHAGSG
ncbi:MAG: signal peptidase II [Solirubrobacterales bacterium]